MFGFEVHNGDGELVTDSSYSGYGLLQEGTVVVVTHAPSYISFPTVTTDSPPIIAVQVQQFNSYWIRLCKVVGTPGNWTGALFVGDRLTTQYPGTITWKYRVYAPGRTSSDSFGMQIFNEDGQATFDSGVPQMEFQDVVTTWQDWPIAYSAQDSMNKFLWYKDIRYDVPSDAWIPLSLVIDAYATNQRSNISGKWVYYGMEVEITWVWDAGRIMCGVWMYSSVTPLQYELIVTAFCPIILN